MGEISLFRINSGEVEKLRAKFVELEKSLQILIENNMEEFFGIRFLASEYSTGKVHNGRIDSLGIDENNSPVILEYKRSSDENVINQGLYYLDWLLDHKAEFELLVMKSLGSEVSERIDWQGARLLCVAGDFNKYDEHAVKQINRNIELIRYRKYDELLLFELVNSNQATTSGKTIVTANNGTDNKYKSIPDFIKDLDDKTKERYQGLKDYIMNLGDDVQEKETKLYIAFKKIKNFVTVTFTPREGLIYLYLKLDPNDYSTIIAQYPEIIRNVKNIGHWGTGDIEIKVRSDQELDIAKQMILESYEKN